MTHRIPEVNNKSTAYLTVSLYDKDDNLADPSSATYTLLDKDGEVVNSRENVSLPFSGGTAQITLTKADNTMVDPVANTKEYRRVVVTGEYAADDEITDSFVYYIRSLEKK